MGGAGEGEEGLEREQAGQRGDAEEHQGWMIRSTNGAPCFTHAYVTHAYVTHAYAHISHPHNDSQMHTQGPHTRTCGAAHRNVKASDTLSVCSKVRTAPNVGVRYIHSIHEHTLTHTHEYIVADTADQLLVKAPTALPDASSSPSTRRPPPPPPARQQGVEGEGV